MNSESHSPRRDGATQDTDANNNSFNMISAADLLAAQHRALEEGEIPEESLANVLHHQDLDESHLIQDQDEAEYYQHLQEQHNQSMAQTSAIRSNPTQPSGIEPHQLDFNRLVRPSQMPIIGPSSSQSNQQAYQPSDDHQQPRVYDLNNMSLYSSHLTYVDQSNTSILDQSSISLEQSFILSQSQFQPAANQDSVSSHQPSGHPPLSSAPIIDPNNLSLDQVTPEILNQILSQDNLTDDVKSFLLSQYEEYQAQQKPQQQQQETSQMPSLEEQQQYESFMMQSQEQLQMLDQIQLTRELTSDEQQQYELLLTQQEEFAVYQSEKQHYLEQQELALQEQRLNEQREQMMIQGTAGYEASTRRGDEELRQEQQQRQHQQQEQLMNQATADYEVSTRRTDQELAQANEQRLNEQREQMMIQGTAGYEESTRRGDEEMYQAQQQRLQHQQEVTNSQSATQHQQTNNASNEDAQPAQSHEATPVAHNLRSQQQQHMNSQQHQSDQHSMHDETQSQQTPQHNLVPHIQQQQQQQQQYTVFTPLHQQDNRNRTGLTSPMQMQFDQLNMNTDPKARVLISLNKVIPQQMHSNHSNQVVNQHDQQVYQHQSTPHRQVPSQHQEELLSSTEKMKRARLERIRQQEDQANNQVHQTTSQQQHYSQMQVAQNQQHQQEYQQEIPYQPYQSLSQVQPGQLQQPLIHQQVESHQQPVQVHNQYQYPQQQQQHQPDNQPMNYFQQQQFEQYQLQQKKMEEQFQLLQQQNQQLMEQIQLQNQQMLKQQQDQQQQQQQRQEQQQHPAQQMQVQQEQISQQTEARQNQQQQNQQQQPRSNTLIQIQRRDVPGFLQSKRPSAMSSSNLPHEIHTLSRQQSSTNADRNSSQESLPHEPNIIGNESSSDCGDNELSNNNGLHEEFKEVNLSFGMGSGKGLIGADPRSQKFQYINTRKQNDNVFRQPDPISRDQQHRMNQRSLQQQSQNRQYSAPSQQEQMQQNSITQQPRVGGLVRTGTASSGSGGNGHDSNENGLASDNNSNASNNMNSNGNVINLHNARIASGSGDGGGGGGNNSGTGQQLIPNYQDEAYDYDDEDEDDEVEDDTTKHFIPIQELAPYMKSKMNVYRIFAEEGQMYLPPFDECTMQFIRDIVNGKKKVFRNHKLKVIKVPFFDEFSAKNITDEIKSKPEEYKHFLEYLPDITDLVKPLTREYLFNVINTVDPSFFRENIKHAFYVRKMKMNEQKKSGCEIQAFILDLIKGSNQITHGERGRALHLLKVGAKKRPREQSKKKSKYDMKIGLGQGQKEQRNTSNREKAPRGGMGAGRGGKSHTGASQHSMFSKPLDAYQSLQIDNVIDNLRPGQARLPTKRYKPNVPLMVRKPPTFIATRQQPSGQGQNIQVIETYPSTATHTGNSSLADSMVQPQRL